LPVITPRRNSDRIHDRQRNREVWRTFQPADRDDPHSGEHPFLDGFGPLVSIIEERLPARTSMSKVPQASVEVVTYVLEGALSYESASGRPGAIRAGEFQHAVVGRGGQPTQRNASTTSAARVFRVALRLPPTEQAASLVQRRFSSAERSGMLCTVASPDGRRGSLTTRQDVLVHSAVLLAGHHLVYPLAPARRAWVHVLRGAALLGDVLLAAGDAAGLTDEIAVSLTAREESEVFVIELGA